MSEEKVIMTAEQISQALLSCGEYPQVKAALAIVDAGIELARKESEQRGLDPVKRAEACGGAAFLRLFRLELIDWTTVKPALPPEKQGEQG